MPATFVWKRSDGVSPHSQEAICQTNPKVRPAPPLPRYASTPRSIGRTADDFARYGVECVDELGRLFQILARIVDPGSAAYQLTQTGISLAQERRSAIDMARINEKALRAFREKDRK